MKFVFDQMVMHILLQMSDLGGYENGGGSSPYNSEINIITEQKRLVGNTVSVELFTSEVVKENFIFVVPVIIWWPCILCFHVILYMISL